MEETTLKKIISQHQEMENFFSGGLVVKSTAEHLQQETAEIVSPKGTEELGKIVEEIRKCRKCELGSLRKNAVPGEGSYTAQIAFVGEGPGADEDIQGRPFVGRAGQLLDKIIKAMGLKREDVYICNVIKCRPPENRDPKPEEIISCLPYLQRQLELINPKIIVALACACSEVAFEQQQGDRSIAGTIPRVLSRSGKTSDKTHGNISSGVFIAKLLG